MVVRKSYHHGSRRRSRGPARATQIVRIIGIWSSRCSPRATCHRLLSSATTVVDSYEFSGVALQHDVVVIKSMDCASGNSMPVGKYGDHDPHIGRKTSATKLNSSPPSSFRKQFSHLSQ